MVDSMNPAARCRWGWLLLAALAAQAVPAEEPAPRARGPRYYDAQVEMHEMPLRVQPPRREEPVLPADLGPARPAAVFDNTIPAPLPPRMPNATDKQRDGKDWINRKSDDGDKQDAGRPSGWGWLADDVLKAGARRASSTAFATAGEHPDGARADDPSAWDPETPGAGDDTRLSPTGGASTAAADAPRERDLRPLEHRPALDPMLAPNRDEADLRPRASVWEENRMPEVEVSLRESERAWELARPVELSLAGVGQPAGPAPIAGVLERPSDVSQPLAPRARFSMTDAEGGGSSVGARSSLFAMPAAGVSLPTAGLSDWGGVGSGAVDVNPLPLQPVQSLPSLSVATPSVTPSLGGMGAEMDATRPKTLPW